jgi:PAS domain S-box-containing protein
LSSKVIDAILDPTAARLKHLENLISSVPAIVWEAWGQPDSASQRIQFVSGYIETMLGYSVEEWLSTPNFWLNIVHADDKARAAREAAAIYAGCSGGRSEFRWIAKDGRIVWAENTIVVLKDDNGRPAGLRGVSVNVTDRKDLERQLERTRADLQAVFEAATQVSMVATEQDGLIKVFNPGAEKMLGYSADEVVDRATPQLFHLNSEIEARARELSSRFGRRIEGFDVFVEVARRNGTEDREWTYVRKDGSSLTVNLGVTTLHDAEGRVTGFLGIAKDVTQQKLIEAELKSAAQLKSDFLSFATHQLRTPLTGIRWLLELALRQDAPEEHLSLVNDAKQSAERLIRMVNDLLDASRLESGRLPLDPEDTDLAEVTRTVLKDVKPEIEVRNHRASFTERTGIPTVCVDKEMFRQIITNLMSNAIKYTLPGGQITIDLRHENGMLVWTVQDNGIGVPRGSQPRLFEKFFRADNVFKLETEGTGLGLCIVRLVVEQAGGRVFFESEEGKGSTFGFEIPVKECGRAVKQ